MLICLVYFHYFLSFNTCLIQGNIQEESTDESHYECLVRSALFTHCNLQSYKKFFQFLFNVSIIMWPQLNKYHWIHFTQENVQNICQKIQLNFVSLLLCFKHQLSNKLSMYGIVNLWQYYRHLIKGNVKMSFV